MICNLENLNTFLQNGPDVLSLFVPTTRELRIKIEPDFIVIQSTEVNLKRI